MAATRGRPRDPNIDVIVLDATRRLLAEEGFAATTVQEVARRSGVHPPAIYRRWPTRLALIEHAALGDFGELRVRVTGNLRADLRRFLLAYESVYATPVFRAAMPGLLAHYQDTAAVDPARWTPYSVQPLLESILDAAPPGTVDPTIETDTVFNVVVGVVLARAFVPPAGQSDLDGTVDLLVRALRPA